jgi:hypothetical protein
MGCRMNEETNAQTQDPPPPKPLVVNPHHSAYQRGAYRAIFQSTGMLSSPTPPLPDAYLRLTFDVDPESAEELNWLISETGEDAGEVFQKAISLLKLAREAVKANKVVGAASSTDNLDVEFAGI